MGPSAAAAVPPPGDERDELGEDSLEDAGERDEVLLTVRSMAVGGVVVVAATTPAAAAAA